MKSYGRLLYSFSRSPSAFACRSFARPHVVAASPRRARLGLPLFLKSYVYGQAVGVRKVHGLSAVLLPPVVFVGLVITLWTWKCLMMVLFQNKIIYMPGLPPNARKETISDYVAQCYGISWREERAKAADGTRISLCVAAVENKTASTSAQPPIEKHIIYFQGVSIPILSAHRQFCLFLGNASSLPSRLPFLSSLLQTLRHESALQPIRYTMACVSYRGYWTSKGSPSEKGLQGDAMGAVAWALSRHSAKGHVSSSQPLELILWGQSIGAAVASNLAAAVSENLSKDVAVKTLILETPFTNVRDMLIALYPQKWLPYRYLWPFLWNHLDSLVALDRMALQSHASKPEVVIINAGKDEIVPIWHGDVLEKQCVNLGFKVQRHIVRHALHTEVMMRPDGRTILRNAIRASSN